MPSEIYEQIKSSLDIVDLIGERVKLRRSGRGYLGLCPFHNEKTPSFFVYPDTQSFYCFGCHASGNIFTYVMKTEGLEFREALELLAGRAGIELKSYEHKRGERSLYDILEMSAKFFSNNLKNSQGTAARAYIERRKLEKSDIERFTLGYSLSSWDGLTEFLRKQGISDRQILSSGLAIQNQQGIYDRFRGRLIFPIRSISGKILAFGGRLIDGDGAKYINSPETEIYSKRKNLYLLNEARNFIREKRRSILVEGYMDALRLHKCGFREAVASLGTSLTPEQAELLSRFADRCYICYDSDTAGKSAALRGMYILQEHGLDVQVVNVPEGKDPDEFLCSNPPEKFEDALTNAKPLILAHIDFLRPALKDNATKKSAVQELIDSLKNLNSEEVLQYRAQISEATLIPSNEIEQRIFGDARPISTAQEKERPEKEKRDQEKYDKEKFAGQKFSREDLLEAGLCAMLMSEQDCRLQIEPEEVYEILQNKFVQDTAYSILTGNPETLPELWLSNNESDKIGLLEIGKNFCTQLANLTVSEKWAKIYNDLKARRVKQRLKEISTKMKTGEASREEMQELESLQKQREKYGR